MSETRRTDDLRVHPRADVVPFPDPETHEQMAADVERRGIVVPLDILADGTVLDGRTRLSIARVLGLAEVPVRVVETADPYDYMVRAAFMRRDLRPSQKAALALELPEYQAAKAKAAERVGGRPSEKPSVSVRTVSPEPPVHAAAVAAQVAGVSTSYVEKADYVRQRDPELFEQIKSGEVTVDAAKKAVKARENEEDVPQPKASTGRLPVPKRTRPARPWANHFTRWVRQALPEDKPVLEQMAREIAQALQRIEERPS